MITRKEDHSLVQLMTFKWGVKGNDFYMSDMYLSKDGHRIFKAFSDQSTHFEFSGSELRTFLKDGSWKVWTRTSNLPVQALLNAIPHD